MGDRLRKRRPVNDIYPTSFLIEGIGGDINKRPFLMTVIFLIIEFTPVNNKLSQLTDKVGVFMFLPLSIHAVYHFRPFGGLMLSDQERKTGSGTHLYKQHLLVLHSNISDCRRELNRSPQVIGPI